jgi:hypothetical protein
MNTKRKCSDAKRDAATIAREIVADGSSDGWCGDPDLLDEIKRLLAPFNIGYVDDFTGRWAKVEPKPAESAGHDCERRGMRVIMRWEGAKRPGYLPEAVIFYEHTENGFKQYAVHYERLQPNGRWSLDGGYYRNIDDQDAYSDAAKEFMQRTEGRCYWYTDPHHYERIEQFIK